MPDDGYGLARAVTARAGRTYYLASALLPAPRRRGVFALYGFARMADDIADGGGSPAAAAAALDALEAGLDAALSGTEPAPGSPAQALTVDQWQLVAALADTLGRYAIDPATCRAFLHSMRMDIPGTPEFRNRYDTFDELGEYTYGSAAVIGLQMLGILGVAPGEVRRTPDGTVPYETVAAGAALLGEAFQLTNFLRDIGEDLDRDRIYLPAAETALFGVDEDLLRADAARKRTSAPLRRALAHLISINRDQYRRTATAVAALPLRTRPAIAAAARSYAGILTEIEDAGYDVFARRAVVPVRRRLLHAGRATITGGR